MRPRLGDEFVRPSYAYSSTWAVRACIHSDSTRLSVGDVTRRSGRRGKGAIPSYGIYGRINRPSGHRHPCRATLFSPPLAPKPSAFFLSSFLSLSLFLSHPNTYAPCRDPYNSVFIPVFSVPGHGIDIAHYAWIYKLFFSPSLRPPGPRSNTLRSYRRTTAFYITRAVQSFL